MPRKTAQDGFTLIELVVVILISGILSIAVMQFITAPIDAYVDQSRRARLVDEAQTVLQQISYDVRLAVPNSIRVGCGGRCVELMRAVSGGRYRASPPGDALSFTPGDADASFEALGAVGNTVSVTTSANASACRNGTASCVVIYNTGFSGTDLWNGDNAATVTSVVTGSPTTVGFSNAAFSSGQAAFPAPSPGQRFFLTDTAVTYLCDPAQRTLRRYWGYSLASNQSAVDTHAELVTRSNPAENALLGSRISACQFQYAAGTPTRNALLMVRLSVVDSGETVSLLEQVGVGNLP